MNTQNQNELFSVYHIETNSEQLLSFNKETWEGLKVLTLSDGEIRDGFNLLIQFKDEYYLMQNADLCDLQVRYSPWAVSLQK